MKIRMGFVSNSSSSSFIVSAKTLTKDDVEPLLEKKENVWCLGDRYGRSGDCAEDFFELTQDMFDAILTHNLESHFKFYLVYSKTEDFIAMPQPKDATVFKVEQDYRPCENKFDIIERYADLD